MRPYQFLPPPQQIALPTCAKCDALMWLASIEPDKPGHDRRTFECPKCQEVLVEVVKYR
jgi:hypothetical protein